MIRDVANFILVPERCFSIVTWCNRCGLCGGSSDGERAAEPPSDTLVTQGSVSSQLLDENCPADGASEGKKADGFGADKGWLGRLLGPLGEHVGVSGAWIHENCAIWSPEVCSLLPIG